MNQKKLEKLQKLYALASNNPNQNEAIVAAHKFINAIKKDGLHMTLSEQPQATQEQINQALQANYQKGFTEGSQHSYNQGYQAGYAEGDGLKKVLRLGLNPATIRGISRFAGLPGLAISTAMTAYDQYEKYKDGEGFIYKLFNKEGT